MQAKAAERTFIALARTTGVSTSARVIEHSGGRDALLRAVRARDLAVLQQPDRDSPRAADDYVQETILEGGRPCLIPPHSGDQDTDFDTITIAWDGSRAAARALADAMPFLRNAIRIELVRIETCATSIGEDDAEEVLRHLARHGVGARFRSIATTSSFSETMLSHVADTGAGNAIAGSSAR